VDRAANRRCHEARRRAELPKRAPIPPHLVRSRLGHSAALFAEGRIAVEAAKGSNSASQLSASLKTTQKHNGSLQLAKNPLLEKPSGLNSDRRSETIFNQILLGQATFLTGLRFGNQLSVCRACDTVPRSPADHFLFQCPNFAEQRYAMFDRILVEKTELHRQACERIAHSGGDHARAPNRPCQRNCRHASILKQHTGAVLEFISGCRVFSDQFRWGFNATVWEENDEEEDSREDAIQTASVAGGVPVAPTIPDPPATEISLPPPNGADAPQTTLTIQRGASRNPIATGEPRSSGGKLAQGSAGGPPRRGNCRGMQ
jgi:hypothetical protein